ncbi:hypothetical protein LHGZ1_0871 [Laribacter hongkongensis]|uniref:Uncharacterized protein n=1 Tax=Laribacter hongkongensis TaxID=168471 RepID=A0A248LGE0_9NEIS|nr:hypothetical protein LHGZ1_0871 [Laribacter hongkongensis]
MSFVPVQKSSVLHGMAQAIDSTAKRKIAPCNSLMLFNSCTVQELTV